MSAIDVADKDSSFQSLGGHRRHSVAVLRRSLSQSGTGQRVVAEAGNVPRNRSWRGYFAESVAVAKKARKRLSRVPPVTLGVPIFPVGGLILAKEPAFNRWKPRRGRRCQFCPWSE